MTSTRASRSDGRRTAVAARRREREAEIIQATRALFDRQRSGEAQIGEIAEATGHNRAILYRHFTGKEELVALTLVDYLDELKQRLDTVTGATPTERVARLTETFVDFGMEFPAFVDCAYALMRRPGPELLDEISESAMLRLGRAISACLGVPRRTLHEGNATGEFAVEDPDLLSNTLYAVQLGGMQLARVGLAVTEGGAGAPGVASVSPEQVREHLVASALAMATNGVRT
ncbi:TetR/AcrR family transcriptional regulator [Nocardioidaceae bacterium]|nr:TetR/AcrR family transcriptional regulator [Nocardioidaceae bacterium]